jgi:hypothetical protein
MELCMQEDVASVPAKDTDVAENKQDKVAERKETVMDGRTTLGNDDISLSIRENETSMTTTDEATSQSTGEFSICKQEVEPMNEGSLNEDSVSQNVNEEGAEADIRPPELQDLSSHAELPALSLSDIKQSEKDHIPEQLEAMDYQEHCVNVANSDKGLFTVEMSITDHEVKAVLCIEPQGLLRVHTDTIGSTDTNGNVSSTPDSSDEPAIVSMTMAVTDDEKLMERNVPDEEKEIQQGETDSAKLAARDVSARDSPVITVTQSDDQELEDESSEDEEQEVETAPVKASDSGIVYGAGQWSPQNQAGDKKYDRDFLLQFQKLCVTRPQSLPNVDCVLSQMVTHSAHSLQRQAFNQRKNFGRDDPFVPLWQKDKSRQYSRQKSHDKQQKARKVIQPVQEVTVAIDAVILFLCCK